MKSKSLFLLFICFMSLCFLAHAEDGCPPGMVPEGGPGVSSCRPIPGYDQSSGQSQQSAIRWASRWGAIVIDDGATNVGLGVATGMSSKQKAEDTALIDCRTKGGSDCKISLTYSNQCAVLIAGIHYARGQAASTINEASALGLKECNAAGVPGCVVYYSACSAAERVQEAL